MDFGTDDRDRGDMPEAFAPHFEGTARFQHFESPFEAGPAVFAVHFQAGARTKPHVHHSGQVLYVTRGEGVVSDRAGRHVVRAGDVVTVGRDEWHWHGGTPESAMSHLTVQMPGSGDVEWDVDEGDWASGYDHLER
ncbi:MAG: cupin domain-containing protein [Acidimicrobiales bacterium]